jgi:hypothetical protein
LDIAVSGRNAAAVSTPPPRDRVAGVRILD